MHLSSSTSVDLWWAKTHNASTTSAFHRQDWAYSDFLMSRTDHRKGKDIHQTHLAKAVRSVGCECSFLHYNTTKTIYCKSAINQSCHKEACWWVLSIYLSYINVICDWVVYYCSLPVSTIYFDHPCNLVILIKCAQLLSWAHTLGIFFCSNSYTIIVPVIILPLPGPRCTWLSINVATSTFSPPLSERTREGRPNSEIASWKHVNTVLALLLLEAFK